MQRRSGTPVLRRRKTGGLFPFPKNPGSSFLDHSIARGNQSRVYPPESYFRTYTAQHRSRSRKELQQIMSNYVGIVRSKIRLKRALDRLEIIYRETENLYNRSTVSVKLCELRNAINVSYLIIRQAQERRESRGLHYNIDYPNKYPE